MGIFDFFKRKKDIEENIDLEEALNIKEIKEIKEEDNTIINTINNETDNWHYFDRWFEHAPKSILYCLQN